MEFFSEKELMCKCGCGINGMKAEFVQKLNTLRAAYGKPMVISSAYRCAHHNGQVSMTGENGPHTTGCAIDVMVFGADAFNLLALVLSHGFTGIGVKQKGPMPGRFLHLDHLPDGAEQPRSRVWSY